MSETPSMSYIMSEISSDRALVCFKEHRTGDGVGNVAYVLLSDGCLLDCGSGEVGRVRASRLAAIINTNSPQQFSKSNLAT